MPGQPAARVGDNILCPVANPVPPGPPTHSVPPGLPIVPPGAPTVFIGNQPAARVGDKCLCITPAGPLPDPIIKGAFPVPIANAAAARATDNAAHPGSTIQLPCCQTVLIGLAGTSGNPWAGKVACQNAAAGRNPAPGSTDASGNPIQAGTSGQSYNNCGIESARQIINQATGANLSQEGLMSQAIANGQAYQPAIGSVDAGTGATVTAANQAFFSGGTSAADRVAILNANGVPASAAPMSGAAPALADVEAQLSGGRGVIAAIDTNGMPGWGTQSGPHAITVTGYEYDENGNIKNVIYNDTGVGRCQVKVTAQRFQNALNGRTAMAAANGQSPVPFVSTTNPIW